ncbi:MAG TPA: NAD(P)-dependent oxidoreductase, partial [Alphaproteobacteria bacterium]|nr:NAD(P)-dependent oxidoreductase [Alphaproteobacteria bacterium]
MARVAFLGLGAMGFHMAGHVAKAGHDIAVYNRTLAKATDWVAAHSGRVAVTPAEAVRDADFVCVCLGNDAALREVALGEAGAFAAMKPGAVFVDHTTATAGIARELAADARKRGLEALDAPVSGGQTGAKNGQLKVMAGGAPAAFARAEPVMRSYAKAVTLMGPPGAGQLTKMVNQICIAGLMQALAEGINFAIKAGLDPERMLSVISQGSAQSWTMENRGRSMAKGEFKPGFTVDW